MRNQTTERAWFCPDSLIAQGNLFAFHCCHINIDRRIKFFCNWYAAEVIFDSTGNYKKAHI